MTAARTFYELLILEKYLKDIVHQDISTQDDALEQQLSEVKVELTRQKEEFETDRRQIPPSSIRNREEVEHRNVMIQKWENHPWLKIRFDRTELSPPLPEVTKQRNGNLDSPGMIPDSKDAEEENTKKNIAFVFDFDCTLTQWNISKIIALLLAPVSTKEKIDFEKYIDLDTRVKLNSSILDGRSTKDIVFAQDAQKEADIKFLLQHNEFVENHIFGGYERLSHIYQLLTFLRKENDTGLYVSSSEGRLQDVVLALRTAELLQFFRRVTCKDGEWTFDKTDRNDTNHQTTISQNVLEETEKGIVYITDDDSGFYPVQNGNAKFFQNVDNQGKELIGHKSFQITTVESGGTPEMFLYYIKIGKSKERFYTHEKKPNLGEEECLGLQIWTTQKFRGKETQETKDLLNNMRKFLAGNDQNDDENVGEEDSGEEDFD